MSRVTLLVSICDKLSDIGFFKGVKHIPEVFMIRLSAFWKLVREKTHDSLVALNFRPEILDAQLIIFGHIDLPYGIDFHKLIFI